MNSPIASKLWEPTAQRVSGTEPVIRLEAVSVRFRVPHERIISFKEYAIRLLKRSIDYQEVQALRDINLEINRGEVLGIIGRNGAGKSTLLKVIAQVLRPSHGRVWVRGRVAPLLELGAGFHWELTGRENVFLNGTLLGFRRAEMSRMFKEIVDFAELGDFINAPLRTYSSGMIVRLGFAVATVAQPDIFLVDEVLAVGDEYFQRKCLERMEQFRQCGVTILLVTHSPQLLRSMCNRAAWLDHGTISGLGEVDDMLQRYQHTG
jgi:ABC-type polysaccharide/polyol phosphate transport system ATPase subunit